MAITQTTRFNVYRWSSGADAFTRSQLDASHAQLEALAGGFLQDETRPLAAAEYLGFLFFNTTTEHLSYCDGTQWVELNSFDLPSDQQFNDSASEGVSVAVSRSDHKHGFPGFATPVDVSTSNTTGTASTAVRSDHQHRLGALSVSAGTIQTSAVTTTKIGAGAVTQTKLGANSVGAAQIQTGAVGASELATDSVGAAEIQANAVGTSEIAAGAVGTTQVGTIDASKITGTMSTVPDIDASKVVSGTLSTLRIPNLAASKITSGAFNAARIPSLDASKIASGTINAARIPNLAATKITSGDLPDARAPERIKTTFAGVERSSRIYVNTNGPSGGQAYDIWIEY